MYHAGLSKPVVDEELLRQLPGLVWSLLLYVPAQLWHNIFKYILSHPQENFLSCARYPTIV